MTTQHPEEWKGSEAQPTDAAAFFFFFLMFKTIKSLKRFPHFSHVHLEQRIEVIVYVNELLCMFILVAQTHGHAENQSLLQKY